MRVGVYQTPSPAEPQSRVRAIWHVSTQASLMVLLVRAAAVSLVFRESQQS